MVKCDLIARLESKTDDAVKYVFLMEDEKVLEVTYINKHDGKVILCMPNQTGCRLGCKFCYLTDIKDQVKTIRNVTIGEYEAMVEYVLSDLSIEISNNNTLLLSFMGSGEPLFNSVNIVMYVNRCKEKYTYVRGAIATIIPSMSMFDNFVEGVEMFKLDMKVHLSLHYTDDETRREWMPSASDITSSIKLLNEYKGRKEIHYTLIKGINDSDDNMEKLISMTKHIDGITVKFLKFNTKDNSDTEGTDDERIAEICKKFDEAGITNEVYLPPAGDIGGSCGQFLLKYYYQYNCK